eukprot:3513716-Prymnesium_polylepis.1
MTSASIPRRAPLRETPSIIFITLELRAFLAYAHSTLLTNAAVVMFERPCTGGTMSFIMKKLLI